MRRAQGQIIARGKNTWLVRTFAGRDGNDKRQYFSKTIHGTKAEAQRYLTDELTPGKKVPLKIELSAKWYARLLDEKLIRGTTFRHLILTALDRYLSDPDAAAPAAAVPEENNITEIMGYLRRLPAAKLRLLKELFTLYAKYYRSARIKNSRPR